MNFCAQVLKHAEISFLKKVNFQLKISQLKTVDEAWLKALRISPDIITDDRHDHSE